MNRAKIQSEQYTFPYHYLVSPESHTVSCRLSWGLEYLAYQELIATKYVQSGMRLLDVGCGDGFFINRVVPDGVDCVGVDYDERAVALACAMRPPGRQKQFCSKLNAHPDFDLCTAIEVLEHIPDADIPSFLGYCETMLKPGGLFVVCVPTDITKVSAKHYRHYNEALLREHLSLMTSMEWMEARWAVKHNMLRKYIFWLLSNRLWTINSVLVARLLNQLFKRFVVPAGPSNGRHLIAVLKKRSNIHGHRNP